MIKEKASMFSIDHSTNRYPYFSTHPTAPVIIAFLPSKRPGLESAMIANPSSIQDGFMSKLKVK